MACFDITRDILGCFYGGKDWKQGYNGLKRELEECLGTQLQNNRNSFASCFQYQEKRNEKGLYRRIKVYDKTFALLTSRSAMTQLGMNTNGIYGSSYLLRKELLEAKDCGLSRIEISYYADSLEAENAFYASNSPMKAS